MLLNAVRSEVLTSRSEREIDQECGLCLRDRCYRFSKLAVSSGAEEQRAVLAMRIGRDLTYQDRMIACRVSFRQSASELRDCAFYCGHAAQAGEYNLVEFGFAGEMVRHRLLMFSQDRNPKTL